MKRINHADISAYCTAAEHGTSTMSKQSSSSMFINSCLLDKAKPIQ